jgi:hypothetical protein
MRSNVTVVFGPEEVSVDLPSAVPDMAPDVARRWLDDQFVALDCEPLRISGKVLVADKLLAVAAALGPQGLHGDDALRLAFARAATAALSRPVVRIDVDARTVSF